MPRDRASATKVGPAPQPGKKYFTLEEANRALPYVSRIVGDIISTYSQVVMLRRQFESSGDAAAHPETAVTARVKSLDQDYDAQMERLSALVEELQAAGVELKDFEKGLTDFPAVYEGREVLLCWRHGEARVAHWHEVNAGFGERQPVKLLKGSKCRE